MTRLPGFAEVHAAVTAAPARPDGFPLQRLKSPEGALTLRALPHLDSLRAALTTEADAARRSPSPHLPFQAQRAYDDTGERPPFETPYFDRRRRLTVLALDAALHPEAPAAPTFAALEDVLWSVCDEDSWCVPAHRYGHAGRPEAHIVDLFAAETAHALAEILALHGERLHPRVTARVRQHVYTRVLEPLFGNPTPFWWETSTNNWSAVCAGATGLAALTLEDDRERLTHMLDRVLRAQAVFLSGYGQDGGCAEGVTYWSYGFGYYTYFAEALHDFTDGALDVLRGDHVRRIAAFPSKVQLGDAQFAPFSDTAMTVRIPNGLSRRLARKFGLAALVPVQAPSLADNAPLRWAHVTRDLLWSGEHPTPTAPIRSHSAFLPDLAWVVDLHVTPRGVLAFCAKGGHNDEPHNHNDLGHFIVHAGDTSVLTDLGAGPYTRSYFGPERYDALHTSSLGHSVPLLDGAGQHAGADHAAQVLTHERRPDGTDFSLDLTRAYVHPALRGFTRTFTWTRDDHGAHLTLQDDFTFTRPTSVEERFVSRARPDQQPDHVRWHTPGGDVRLELDPAWQVVTSAVTLKTHEHHAEEVHLLHVTLPTSANISAALHFHVTLPAPHVQHAGGAHDTVTAARLSPRRVP